MNLFKAKRIEKNLTIEDILKEINYPRSVIEDLEDDILNFLPKPYAYYCARAYGKYLNIINLSKIIEKYK